MTLEHLLSHRTRNMQANAIREILKVVSQPGMISLAGGIPAPESFPLEEIYELSEIVLTKYGPRALQYDATEGFAPLKEALVAYLAQKEIKVSPEELLIFSGSQGVLNALGGILISPGDSIVVEAPTYLGAISAFNPYEPRYISAQTDDQGMIPESLEEILQSQTVKFVYLVSTFQNPTGRTLSAERRKQIAGIIQKHNVLLIEDDPYSNLRYRGEYVAPVHSFAPENVAYVSTLSKVFAPGLRIGFCVAPPAIRKWLVIAKQGIDLHTSTFNQALAAEYLTGGYLEQQLPRIIALYKPRQEALFDALRRHFPEGFRWIEPEGGMFVWVEGPQEMDAEQLYWKAVEKKVAFVPGKFFYANQGEGESAMRLNFTMIDEFALDRAIRVLAELPVKAPYKPA